MEVEEFWPTARPSGRVLAVPQVGTAQRITLEP
jgi:hypothetical protein